MSKGDRMKNILILVLCIWVTNVNAACFNENVKNKPNNDCSIYDAYILYNGDNQDRKLQFDKYYENLVKDSVADIEKLNKRYSVSSKKLTKCINIKADKIHKEIFREFMYNEFIHNIIFDKTKQKQFMFYKDYHSEFYDRLLKHNFDCLDRYLPKK